MSDRESERQKRLGEALRENLKRRKIQSRGRAAPPQVGSERKNDPAEWETLRAIGVDAICTDRIGELAAFVW